MLVSKLGDFFPGKILLQDGYQIGFDNKEWCWPRLWKPKWKHACGHQCSTLYLYCKVQKYSPLLIFCMMLQFCKYLGWIGTFPSGFFFVSHILQRDIKNSHCTVGFPACTGLLHKDSTFWAHDDNMKAALDKRGNSWYQMTRALVTVGMDKTTHVAWYIHSPSMLEYPLHTNIHGLSWNLLQSSSKENCLGNESNYGRILVKYGFLKLFWPWL